MSALVHSIGSRSVDSPSSPDLVQSPSSVGTPACSSVAAQILPTPTVIGLVVHADDEQIGICVQDTFVTWAYHRVDPAPGSCSPDSTAALVTHSQKRSALQLHRRILQWLCEYQQKTQLKIQLVGLEYDGTSAVSGGASSTTPEEDARSLGELLWLECDILVCVFPPSSLHKNSADARACSVARKALHLLRYSSYPAVFNLLSLNQRHEVLVDAGGKIQFTSLKSYQAAAQDIWPAILAAADVIRGRQLHIVFCSSTAQGGGVAIMRHALIRFFRLLDLSARWFVMKPSPDVFEITKKKIHNVLQGVAQPNTHLSEEDQALWNSWCQENFNRYWQKDNLDGYNPVAHKCVIVIDDPQPCGMIPLLRHLYPDAKLVYRSHIELRRDLIEQVDTEQSHVWRFLSRCIDQVDLFVSHPIDTFVPASVTAPRCSMPAVTDIQDGLNKSLPVDILQYYQLLFNHLAVAQVGKKVDFQRPYFLQVARFDLSKGLADLIHAYVAFRQMRAAGLQQLPRFQIPQLVLAGHGSIDDPEGGVIYRQTLTLLHELGAASTASRAAAEDIVVALLPPCDQLLNCLMRGCLVAFQLSLREGFEIKVTEALLKGKPVVAYRSGGIPLQILDGVDGFLVQPGAVQQVAEKMELLTTDSQLRQTMAAAAHKLSRANLLTPANALRWMNVMIKLLGTDATTA